MFGDNILGLKLWMIEGQAQGPMAMMLLFILAMTLVLRCGR